MAALATEMPPLHTAEALAGVQQTANSSSQPPPPTQQNGAVSGVGVVGGSTNGSGGGVIDSSQTSDTDTGPTQSQSSSGNTTNNTISAAADSSDNQPSTPQPHLSNGGGGGDAQQPPTTPHAHHPYANHHIYAAQPHPTTTASSSSNMGQMYGHNIYSSSTNSMDMQQQHQQQHSQTPTQHSAYPSYLNSYEQFYQQQQQQQHPSQNPQMDYINSNSNSSMYSSSSDYKQQSGVRYHPYLHTPTSGLPSSGGPNSSSNNALDAVNSQSAPVVSSASSSVMSPRVVSSTSPTSSSQHMQMSGSASSIGSMSAGNPSSPASGGGAPQCKKCGIMCTNESELQEHIANVHGASPYGSSGYASSPYVKEELQQQTPPSQQQQQQQQQQQSSQQPPVVGGNPGEILDLDSQKMLYPPGQGVMPGMMHPSVGVGVTDPLQSMHSMQQRAGIASWDQQQAEGLPPYMQTTDTKNMPNHSPYYQSPKLSPYHVSNSTNVIKSEYPIIKSEYQSDSQQYMGDKSFDPTAPVSQQMMPPAVSSSPAEFPSTTTGGPQDSQQSGNGQFRAANFEPPTSSSALTTNIGTKAANWKSNEARRPKTYNCTACNKWFTSSGHLKRHYNTTLHKNAVKSSGQPDPATLPISVHHHPAREGATGKTSRRGAAAAATAAANAAAQQQQQPPNPVQPPEPPNSPPDYGGTQTAAGGLTQMSHYAATPSPNSMYQQQQQQYSHNQYMPQVQSTTNASPQHASTMAGAGQQTSAHHQQTVLNGHPNALAGPSVPTTRQQMPIPSSQMRGLLNITTTMLTQKNNHMEAEMEDPDQGLDLREEQQRQQEDQQMEQELELERQQHRLVKEEYVREESSEHSLQSTDADLAEMQEREAPAAHSVVLPPMHPHHQLRYHLESSPADMERLYHNTTPSSTHSSMRVHSPHIISHQQYQEQLQLEQQQIQQGQATYTLTPTPPPLHHNIMEPQHYINMPLAINTQQHNSMLQLQQQLTTTEQQQPPPDTTIHTTNMASMLPPNHLMPQPLQPTELQPLVSTQLQQQQQLDTINTSTQHMLPSHITTSSITSIPSYHQLQQQGSVLQPLDHTLTYPHHTIIGNASSGPLPPINTLAGAEVLTLDAYGNLISASPQQLIQTADGQLVQLISTNTSTGATTLYTQSYNPYLAQRSPQEGDLPPMSHEYKHDQTMEPSMSYSPNLTNSSTSSHSTETKELRASLTEDYINNNFTSLSRRDNVVQETNLDNELQDVVEKKIKATPASSKRKRNPSTSSSVGANSTMLPSGRFKCLPCDKEFTKICYLTQHNKSFHSGEYPFRCQKCGKRYQSEDVYVTHLGKHKTIDKAHKCELCPKQFHHKTDLRRHIEAIHTGNKQHSCDICEKSFCRKDHLRKHLETHNRPRVVTKKAKTNVNRSSTTTAALKKLKNSNNVDNTQGGKGETVMSSVLVQEIKTEIQYQHQSTSEGEGGIATMSTPSPQPMQKMEDVAADDDQLLDEELENYDPQDLNEDEYISIQQYEEKLIFHQHQQQQQLLNREQQNQHHQQQQLQHRELELELEHEQLHLQQQLCKVEEQYVDLGKQSYQIIEHEIPLY